EHGLARGTVVTAFENLKAEGYLYATVGSGTYVACELPERSLEAPSATAKREPGRRASPRRLSAIARRMTALSGYDEGPAPAFRIPRPAVDRFPTELWARVASRRLRMASVKMLLGCDALGYEPLRRAISEYLVTSRGVRCTPDRVAIVSGTLEALNITARLLRDPGDAAAAESPG